MIHNGTFKRKRALKDLRRNSSSNKSRRKYLLCKSYPAPQTTKFCKISNFHNFNLTTKTSSVSKFLQSKSRISGINDRCCQCRTVNNGEDSDSKKDKLSTRLELSLIYRSEGKVRRTTEARRRTTEQQIHNLKLTKGNCKYWYGKRRKYGVRAKKVIEINSYPNPNVNPNNNKYEYNEYNQDIGVQTIPISTKKLTKRQDETWKKYNNKHNKNIHSNGTIETIENEQLYLTTINTINNNNNKFNKITNPCYSYSNRCFRSKECKLWQSSPSLKSISACTGFRYSKTVPNLCSLANDSVTGWASLKTNEKLSHDQISSWKSRGS